MTNSVCVKELTSQPPEGLIGSMAMRYDHSIHMPLIFENEEKHALRKKRIFELMEKLYQTAHEYNRESPLPPVAPEYLLSHMIECYKQNHKSKIPQKTEEDRVKNEDYMRRVMSQLYEEISGYGFYRYQAK